MWNEYLVSTNHGGLVLAPEARQAKLDELLDRTEILDCIHRYARGMDRLDRELVRSAYHDGAIRRDGRWAIAARVCLVEWMAHFASGLPPAAVEFVASIGTVARDRSDTSYERPLVPKRAARA